MSARIQEIRYDTIRYVY